MTNRCETCGGSMPWGDDDGAASCLMCGRTATAPQRAEDFEADQTRIRAKAATGAIIIRYVREAGRPVPMPEIIREIGLTDLEVTDALHVALGRHLITSRLDEEGSIGVPVFEKAG